MLNRFLSAQDTPSGPAIFGPCGECDLVTEADHRIANHLAMLAGFLRLRIAQLPKPPIALPAEDVSLLLEGFRSQVVAIANVHRALSAHGGECADVGDLLRDLCVSMRSLAGGRTALIGDFQPDCRLGAHRILPLTQIASEVLTNALKHARRSGGPGVIAVRCWRNAEQVNVEIADDGPGLPPDFDPAAQTGLGFRLIHALARRVGAAVRFEAGRPGLRFTLTLEGESPQGAGVLAR